MRVLTFTFLALFSCFTLANTNHETVTNRISKSLDKCSHNGAFLNNDDGQRIAGIHNDGCNAITITLEITKYEDRNFNEPKADLMSSKLHKGISLEDILNYNEKKKPSIYAEERRTIFADSKNINHTITQDEFDKINALLKEKSLSFTLYTNEDLKITQKNYRELQIRTFIEIKIKKKSFPEITSNSSLIEVSINTLDEILNLSYNKTIAQLHIQK